MAGLKTNERPGTKAVLRHSRMSASKARQVLDLIRDQEVGRSAELLRTTERAAATVIGGVLASAVANAVHNDGQDPEDLYVSACFADEGATLKRWRPRARGRATRIRKRSCHITIIVSRLPDERLARRRAQRDALGGGRSRRVAESRRRADLSGRLSRRRAAQEQAAELAAAELAAAELAAAEAEEQGASGADRVPVDTVGIDTVDIDTVEPGEPVETGSVGSDEEDAEASATSGSPASAEDEEEGE